MGALVDDVNIRTLNLDFKWKTVAELYECFHQLRIIGGYPIGLFLSFLAYNMD